MANILKKKNKLIERIKFLEDEMLLNLKQKTSSTAEISISEYQNKIAKLRMDLAKL